ncbi:unnamed protein product [Cochlearia groenlandica]
MASEQARIDNVVKEREVQVEKDKTKDSDTQHDREERGETHFVSDKGEGKTELKKTKMPHSVGKFVVISGEKEGKKEKEEEEKDKASLEDIHEFRANAQQKSMDTIRAAEERYNKAKESLSLGGEETRGRRVEHVKEETQQKDNKGGVLGAIGETIAEIQKTTKNIVIGDAPERKHEHEASDYT